MVVDGCHGKQYLAGGVSKIKYLRHESQLVLDGECGGLGEGKISCS